MSSDSKPRNETEHERLDRQLMELLQGFRVAVTGVQVLFAFLLTVPFAVGFKSVDDSGRALFYVALFGAASASICFIAPVFQHRILFQLGQKPLLIRRANRFGIVGALALAVSITAATALIIETLVSDGAAVVAGAAIAVLASWAWFVQPLLSRRTANGLRASELPNDPDGLADTNDPDGPAPAPGDGLGGRSDLTDRTGAGSGALGDD
ncbi:MULTISPECIES: DUF6328 family protein [Actinomadura]|uniref:DUF6328 family protein n=1 Tax=Actinomadura yumaensis TaxID=111807 RepID=A0ABW2CQ75_9ACTN|nr:DUF6328 family protein [Actinomadura sp. J1-007]